MVATTPNNPALKLLIITEFLNANKVLSPFIKDKTSIQDHVNEMLDFQVNFMNIKQMFVNHMLRKFFSLPIGDLFRDSVSHDFSKKGDDYCLSFNFEKEVRSEMFHLYVDIRFKKTPSGTIEAYKKFTYDGPSGSIYADFITELNKALTPVSCAALIEDLFELKKS